MEIILHIVFKSLYVNSILSGSSDHILEDDLVKERELFISDATDVYPATALR